MSRASSSDAARIYRQAGHDDAKLFALLLGLDDDYQRDPKAKKDVIDPAGDAHSVKAGNKNWQIFLYSRNRFLTDDGFQALNGVGSLLIHCIDAFPPRYEDYVDNKEAAKIRLQTPMRELKDRFQRKAVLRAFLRKSIFNAGEVNYLTILNEEDKFDVFWSDDVIRIMANEFEVVNSMARTTNQFDAQKVLFRYKGKNVGELEMRNDSVKHYAQVKFNMRKKRCVQMLYDSDLNDSFYSPEIKTYGKATTNFGTWNLT